MSSRRGNARKRQQVLIFDEWRKYAVPREKMSKKGAKQNLDFLYGTNRRK